MAGPEQVNFSEWSKTFFEYLRLEKKNNSSLLQLIDDLCDGGRQELALSIFNYLRPHLWADFRKNRQRAGRRADRKLAKLIRNLRKDSKDYLGLAQMMPELGPGTILGATAPKGFADLLEAEAERLSHQLELAKTAFNHKQGGNKSDLAILVRLQEFVDEFFRRLGNGNTGPAGRRLSSADLADLMEAGKAALGLPEDDTLTDAFSINRALQRFRKNPDNALICSLLRQDAINLCDSLAY